MTAMSTTKIILMKVLVHVHLYLLLILSTHAHEGQLLVCLCVGSVNTLAFTYDACATN